MGSKVPTKLSVRSDGLVSYTPPSHIKGPCVMDMTYWPYDTHNCTIKIGSWSYDGSEINLDILTSVPQVTAVEDHRFRNLIPKLN